MRVRTTLLERIFGALLRGRNSWFLRSQSAVLDLEPAGQRLGCPGIFMAHHSFGASRGFVYGSVQSAICSHNDFDQA